MKIGIWASIVDSNIVGLDLGVRVTVSLLHGEGNGIDTILGILVGRVLYGRRRIVAKVPGPGHDAIVTDGRIGENHRQWLVAEGHARNKGGGRVGVVHGDGSSVCDHTTDTVVRTDSDGISAIVIPGVRGRLISLADHLVKAIAVPVKTIVNRI